MKAKKIVTLLLVLVMLVGVVAVVPSVSANSSPVNLIYADTVTRSSGGVPPYSFDGAATGYVEVENLGYNKNITIHYNIDGTWRDVAAEYVGPTHGNYEAWKFTTIYQNSGYRGSVGCTFAIKYEVNGQTYWDNNNGNNYYVNTGGISYAPIMVFGVGKVMVKSYSANDTTFQGSVYLENIAYDKDVKIRYTTDDWATYSEISCSYNGSATNNVEAWVFTETLPDDWEAIQFAASYTVNGVTYWDNSFGANYSIIR